MMKKIFLSSTLLLMIVLQSTVALSHSLWFNTNQRECEPGKPVILELGWGHIFPKDTEIREGMLNEVFAIGPTGEKIALKPLSKSTLQFTPPVSGYYVVCGNVHPGFVTKTTQGYKMGPKDQFKQVLTCFHYDLRGTTFLRVGDPETFSPPQVNDPLVITPLENTFDLKAGDTLTVKILFEGKPLAREAVKATYAGFSDKPGTFFETLKTDEQGQAKIQLKQKGEWFVSVTHEIPYSPKSKCDTEKYNATLTFTVR